MTQRLIKTLLLCSAMLMAGSCVKEQTEPVTGPSVDAPSSEMVRGHVRVKVSEELAKTLEANTAANGQVMTVGVKSSDNILSGLGITSMCRTFPYAGKFEARTRAEGMHLWYDIKFSEEVALTKAANDISAIEGIEKIEYRPRITRPYYNIIPVPQIPTATRSAATSLFDDPRLSEQWHYYNDGSYKGIAGCDINVLPVWQNITTGNPDVIVAVVDGGISVSHEDLNDNAWINEAEFNGQEGIDDDGNGYIDDVYGYDFVNGNRIFADDHATHVAGTIAAVNNNGIGVCGVAGGDYRNGIKGARVMSCQIFVGSGVGNTAAAIKYGADNGAVISQNSWGYTLPEPNESDKLAIDYFIKYAGIDENGNQTGPMKGGVVIFAAGNDALSYCSPSIYEPVISVSAIAADYEASWYTNYGSWNDIAAPGGDDAKGQMILSTITRNNYGIEMGTSMACPHVSGVAALIVSQYGGPGFTNEDLKKMLLETTNPIIYDGHNTSSKFKNNLGSGLVDATKAIIGNSTVGPEPISNLSAAGAAYVARLKWTVPADPDDGKPAIFTIYSSEQPFEPSIKWDNLPSEVTPHIVKNTLEPGQTFEYALATEPDKTYYIAVDASDNSLQHSSMSEVIQVKTQTNVLPQVAMDIKEITIKGYSQSVEFDLSKYFVDGNNDPMTFSFDDSDLEAKTLADVKIEGEMLKIYTWNHGKGVIKLFASDPSEEQVESSLTINVIQHTSDKFYCYPNPVIDLMYIKNAYERTDDIKVSVKNASGKEVFTSELTVSSTDSGSIDMRAFAPGRYTVTITDEGREITEKHNILKI